MALSNKKLIGTWKNVPGSVFQARTFDNGATFVLVQVGSDYPDSFIVRGRALAANTTDFTLASGITTDDINLLVASDTAGVTTPSTFVTPPGYVKKFGGDGTPYYENAAERTAFEKGDTDGDGTVDSRSANLFTQATDWVKANPILSIGIAIAVYVFVIRPMQGGKKKKGLLALL